MGQRIAVDQPPPVPPFGDPRCWQIAYGLALPAGHPVRKYRVPNMAYRLAAARRGPFRT